MPAGSRSLSGGLVGFTLLILAVAVVRPVEAMAAEISVTAGNILLIEGRPFRLWGIKPPAADKVCHRKEPEPCAKIARRVLKLLLGDEDFRCSVVKTEADGTVVGRCFVSTADLGHLMVLSGWANDDPDESLGFYQALEGAARAAPAGQWVER